MITEHDKKRTDRAASNRLTERDGVALVCFHLARLGYEYAVTEPACPFGDVWAQIGGRKVGVEVKTTRKTNAWHVKRSQLAAVDFYCFVRLDWGHCYVLTVAETEKIIAASADIYDGVALIQDTGLPADSFKGWSRLGRRDHFDAVRQHKRYPILKKDGMVRAGRVVRRVQRDGSIKEYRYPAYDAL